MRTLQLLLLAACLLCLPVAPAPLDAAARSEGGGGAFDGRVKEEKEAYDAAGELLLQQAGRVMPSRENKDPRREKAEKGLVGVHQVSRDVQAIAHLAEDNGIAGTDLATLRRRLSDHVRSAVKLSAMQEKLEGLPEGSKDRKPLELAIVKQSRVLRHGLFMLKQYAAGELHSHNVTEHDLPFHNPSLESLWDIAKKANFTSDELKSFREELMGHQSELERFRETSDDRKMTAERRQKQIEELHNKFHAMRQKAMQRHRGDL